MKINKGKRSKIECGFKKQRIVNENGIKVGENKLQEEDITVTPISIGMCRSEA